MLNLSGALDDIVGQCLENTVYDPKIGMVRAETLFSSYVHRGPFSLSTIVPA